LRYFDAVSSSPPPDSPPVGSPPPSSEPAVLLISDVDDTVKITHVTRRLRAAVRGLVRRSVYGGMAVLYREMNPALVFISASPLFLEGRLRRTLVQRGGFPAARFVLRDWWSERDVAAFKQAHIEASCRTCNLPVVLVGDDTERDPEVFLNAASRQTGGRVVAIYIRQNLGRPLPGGVIPFRSAFDIALKEHLEGRLSVPSSLRVGKAVLQAARTRVHHLLPPFYEWVPGARAASTAREVGVPRPTVADPTLAQMALEVAAAVR
jgi:hypothetical protein